MAAMLTAAASATAAEISTPILIVGGGASGVTAGIAAARLGTEALIVEETPWVGGMLTAAGVSAIDGNKNLPAGLWGEFRDSLVCYYGSREALRTGWVSDVQFEPNVGEKIMRQMINREKNLSLMNGWTPVGVKHLDDGRWTVDFTNAEGETLTTTSTVLIDATELGDIAAMAGVGYDLGMESKAETGEEVAPAEANSIIQDLTYVAILKDYGHDVKIEKPQGYNPDDFACAAWNDVCVTPKEPERMWRPEKMITYGALPNKKYMINWPIEGNDFYVNLVELTPEQRKEAIAAAKDFTMKFVYFIQNELGMSNLGLADDEYPTDDLLPFIPYHRESRRIHGKVRYTVTDMCSPYAGEPLYRTCIAVGDYPVDQHHKRYTGDETLPDLHFHPVPSFGLPLGTLLPDGTENLIVAEKSISVSNIANGATRLQPVVLQIGQAAGTLAALAVQQSTSPDKVPVRDVQRSILDQGGYLLPYLDVKPGESDFKIQQRIGATGLLRGESRRVGWTNETRLNPDAPLTFADLAPLSEFYDITLPNMSAESDVSTSLLLSLLRQIEPTINEDSIYAAIGNDGANESISRGEYARILDSTLHPFDTPIDHHGHILKVY